MRPKFVIMLFSVCLTLATASQSHAGIVLAEESFSQADGALLASPGGTGFGGDFTGSVSSYTVSSGVVSGNAPLFRDFSDTFDNLATANGTNALYVSYDYQLSAVTGNGFAGVSFFAGGTEQVLIGRLGSGTQFRITDPNGADAPDTSGAAINAGLRTVVARFDLVNDSIDIFVGADATSPVDVSGAPTQTFGSSASFDLGSIDNIRFQTNGNSVAEFDNLILGTSASAVGAVPEPSSLIVLALAGLGFASGRRRA